MPNIDRYIEGLKVKETNDHKLIWDFIRKKWIHFSQEEMIRQCVLYYLVEEKQFSSKLISVEKTIRYYKLNKRYDVVAYDRNSNPIVLVECKSPEVKLNQAAINQINIYNQIIDGQYLWLTNGHEHLIVTKGQDSGKTKVLVDIPSAELI